MNMHGISVLAANILGGIYYLVDCKYCSQGGSHGMECKCRANKYLGAGSGRGGVLDKI